MLRGVGRQLVQGQRQRLRARRLQHDRRPGHLDPPVRLGPVGRQLLVDDHAEVDALPPALREQAVGAGQGLDAPLDGGDEGLARVRTRQPQDRLHDRQDVPRAVVDLPRQEGLTLLGPLALGDVQGDPAHPDDAAVPVHRRRGPADTPAQLAARTHDPELRVAGLADLEDPRRDPAQPLPVLRVQQAGDPLPSRHEARWVNAADAALPLVPEPVAGGEVAIPRAHAARGQRQAPALLALAQLGGRCLQLRRALGDAPLQVLVELLELPGLIPAVGSPDGCLALGLMEGTGPSRVTEAGIIPRSRGAKRTYRPSPRGGPRSAAPAAACRAARSAGNAPGGGRPGRPGPPSVTTPLAPIPRPGRQAARGGPAPPGVASVYLLPVCSSSPVTLRRMSVSATASAPCRPARAATMTPWVRGTPSASSARTEGATRSIKALTSAEPVKVAGRARPAVGLRVLVGIRSGGEGPIPATI